MLPTRIYLDDTYSGVTLGFGWSADAPAEVRMISWVYGRADTSTNAGIHFTVDGKRTDLLPVNQLTTSDTIGLVIHHSRHYKVTREFVRSLADGTRVAVRADSGSGPQEGLISQTTGKAHFEAFRVKLRRFLACVESPDGASEPPKRPQFVR